MEKYNYLESVKQDVIKYLVANSSYIKKLITECTISDFNELSDYLKDELFSNDSVTGNASGSYTCNAWEAEENICHNLDLLRAALKEYGCGADNLQTAEAADVTIRCYLLPQAIGDVLDLYDNLTLTPETWDRITDDITGQYIELTNGVIVHQYAIKQIN